MAAALVAAAVDPDGALSSSFFNAYRPWLSLYGVRLQRQQKQKQVCLQGRRAVRSAAANGCIVCGALQPLCGCSPHLLAA